ncbi:MAG: ABC transporter substrate-binding protein [Saprospiraceae bacterium]|nr:ABC transporter substrate-binding protein [Saprospiraceae bacterium]
MQDMLGRSVRLTQTPQRIISLVPSQTELLHALGLDDRVVGITQFCVHPPAWKRKKTIVGGTKRLHFDRITALQPDLIIANKEENNQADIEQLEAICPVWVSDVSSIETATQMILEVGQLTDTSSKAIEIVEHIARARLELNQFPICSVAYLIWNDPIMTVGGDTFINAMLHAAGFENIYADRKRYPTLDLEQLAEKQPQYLLLSSEPFPFKAKHVQRFENVLKHTKVVLVDGEYFSWYGSRMQEAFSYFSVLRNSVDLTDKSS